MYIYRRFIVTSNESQILNIPVLERSNLIQI